MSELQQWIDAELTRTYLAELERGIEDWIGRPLGVEIPWTCRHGVWAQRW